MPLVAAAERILAVLEAHHAPSAAHSRRVADLCAAVAGPSVWPAAAVHDCGKCLVSLAVLTAPRALDALEYACMKDHCWHGCAVLEAHLTLVPTDFLTACWTHHERWDGSGYPRHLAGEEIPWLGRLIAVADSYDAMREDRPYRVGLAHAVAIGELERGAGAQFDPALVVQVIAVLEETERAA